MNPIVILAIVGGAIIAALVYVAFRDDQERDPLQERLAQFGERETPQTLEEIELSLSFRDRVIVPITRALGRFAAKFTPQSQLEMSRGLLETAGYRQFDGTIHLLCHAYRLDHRPASVGLHGVLRHGANP